MARTASWISGRTPGQLCTSPKPNVYRSKCAIDCCKIHRNPKKTGRHPTAFRCAQVSFLCHRPVTGETSISSIFDDLLVLSLRISIQCPPKKNGKMRVDWMMKQRTPKQSAYLCRWEFCFVCLRIYSFGISRPAATVLWHWPPSCSFQKNFPETAVAMETVPGQVKQGEEGGTGVRLPLDHFSTRWKWNSFFSIVVPFCPGFGTAKTQRLLRIKADLTKIAI